MKKALFKSSSFRFLEISIEIIISVLLTPFLIYNLGDNHYGLWVLIISTMGWFKFADLGFSYAVQRNIILAIEKSDHKKVNVTYSVAIVLFGVLGLFAAAGVAILGFFPSVLGVEEANHTITAIALSILALKVFWDFMMNCFHGFFSAYLRMDISANLSSLNTIIRSILIFYLIKDMNIYGAVLATMAADLFTNILKVYYAKKLNSNFRFNIKLVKWSEIVELFNFSKHVIASSVAMSIKGRVDPIIIANLFNLKMVALYSVTSRLVVQLESLVTGLVGIFQPVLLKLIARNIPIDNIFKQIVSLNFFIVVLLYTPLAIFAESFITLWIGSSYAGAASLAFILGFAFICRTISRPINSVLLAQANHKILSIVNLFGAILNIILSIFLGKVWGLEGIAIATALAFFISDVLLHLLLFKHYNNKPIFPLLLKFALICALYAIFVFIGKYLISLVDPLSWLELILSAVICEITIVILTWHLILQKETRNQLQQVIFKRQN